MKYRNGVLYSISEKLLERLGFEEDSGCWEVCQDIVMQLCQAEPVRPKVMTLLDAATEAAGLQKNSLWNLLRVGITAAYRRRPGVWEQLGLVKEGFPLTVAKLINAMADRVEQEAARKEKGGPV